MQRSHNKRITLTLGALMVATAGALFSLSFSVPAATTGVELSDVLANGSGGIELGWFKYVALGGLIINRQSLRDLFIGFQQHFNQGFEDAPTTWNQIATEVPSTTKENRYGWLGQWPALREWIGDRHIMGLAAHAYSILNRKFESSVAVPRDDLEDDTYGVYAPMMKEMGRAAKVHPDQLVYEALKNGFTEPAYDGQYFFDTDHPVGDGTVSNLTAGGGNPWYLLDGNRALKPLIYQVRRPYAFTHMTNKDDESVFMRDEYRYGIDARSNVGYGFWQMAHASQADLDTANFNAAYDAMLSLKSDEGRPLAIMPSLLVCGPSNRTKADEVLNVQRLASGADNPNFNKVKVLVTPYLA